MHKQLPYKVLFLGPSKCGKTSFLSYYANQKQINEQKYHPTIGVDFLIKKLTINDKLVKLQMWDTSGSQKFSQINKVYYTLTSIFIFMFDLSDLESFEKLKKMLQYPDFINHMESSIKNERSPLMLLIGCKSDLQQKVPDHLIQQISQHFTLYSKTSSKTGQNIQSIIKQITQNKVDDVPYIWNPYYQKLMNNLELQQQNAAPGQTIQQKSKQQKVIKILLVGPANAGKTSLIHSYLNGTFQKDYTKTIGVQFKCMYYGHQNTTIKLQFWDTAGQQKLRALPNAFYKGTQCVFIVYDCTNQKDFKGLTKYTKQFQQYANENCYVCLVGTKCDLVNQKKVTTQMGMQFASQNKLDFIELSSINDSQNKNLSNLIQNGVNWAIKYI